MTLPFFCETDFTDYTAGQRIMQYPGKRNLFAIKKLDTGIFLWQNKYHYNIRVK
jgi:hypothetical protein